MVDVFVCFFSYVPSQLRENFQDSLQSAFRRRWTAQDGFILIWQSVEDTLPETNIAPENGGFNRNLLFQCPFSGAMLVSGSVILKKLRGHPLSLSNIPLECFSPSRQQFQWRNSIHILEFGNTSGLVAFGVCWIMYHMLLHIPLKTSISDL